MGDAASPADELFGTLRLPVGGKHGYIGVRGGQGKKRNLFQAYITVESKKVTVPGLHGDAHGAAVALAQWKQQRELGLAEETAARKPRKRRTVKPANQPSAASQGDTPRVPLQLTYMCNAAPRPAAMAQPETPSTTKAVLLPRGVPAAAYGVPVTLGQLAYIHA